MRTMSTARLATAIALIATLLVASAAAGAAGAALILGQTNDAGSSLTTLRATSNPTLRVVNNGSGRALEAEANSAVPLRVIAPEGFAPMTVNSTTKVINLNADRLDGLNSTAFLRADTIVTHHLGPWQPDPLTDSSVEPRPAWNYVIGNTAGLRAFFVYLETPSSIGSADYALSSVELCMDDVDPNPILDQVEVYASTSTTETTILSDSTDHAISGALCVMYTDLTPTAVDGAYSLWARWNFADGGDSIIVRRVEATWVPV